MPTSSYSYLPLRWESTGDQWWYATPIDWAAANGLSDLVKQLLHIDPNLLIKLTSLRRIRRLESVWDDVDPTNAVARCRARVARALLSACEPSCGARENSLIRAGYGGWLLYSAASAGDVGFVKELLERENVSVFGEGEYGITDILYAAARSKNSEVFRFLFEFSMNVVRSNEGGDNGFLWEMMNRAVHAAARGGNLEVLKELLGDSDDILAYRDAQGSSVLHSAASRGQVEVVKYLIATYEDIINSTDDQGNTALHIAAHRGYSSVVEALAHVSLSLCTSKNKDGDTFLHLAVAGFRSPGFHRIDQQIDFMKQLVSGKIISLKDIVNIRNDEGRTVLHIAVAQNIQLDVVQLLMSVPSVDLNFCDVDGFTPLDLLKRSPRTPTTEILIKQIASAGGISGCQDENNENALAGNFRAPGIGASPGSSFRLLDAEFCGGNDNDSEDCEPPSSRFSSCSSEPTSHLGSPTRLDPLHKSKKSTSSRRFNLIPHWPRRGERNIESSTEEGRNSEAGIPIPLREKFSRTSSNQNNNKGSSFPSPSVKERFAASLMQGVIQATPPKSCFSSGRFSSFSSFSKSLASSPTSRDQKLSRGDHRETNNNVARSSFFSGPLNGGRSSQGGDNHRRVSSFNKSLMNQYFCFGAQGLAVEDSVANRPGNRSCRKLVF